MSHWSAYSFINLFRQTYPLSSWCCVSCITKEQVISTINDHAMWRHRALSPFIHPTDPIIRIAYGSGYLLIRGNGWVYNKIEWRKRGRNGSLSICVSNWTRGRKYRFQRQVVRGLWGGSLVDMAEYKESSLDEWETKWLINK